MAEGTTDSNGIWQYGEDDNAALFSTLLNKLAGTVSAAIGSLKGRVAALEVGPPPNAQLTAASAQAVQANTTTVLRAAWPATLPAAKGNRRITFSGNNVTTGGEFTPTVPGIYRVSFHVLMSAGTRIAMIQKNGVVIADAVGDVPAFRDIDMNGTTDKLTFAVSCSVAASNVANQNVRASIVYQGPLT